MMDIPIISLEIQDMKSTIKAALDKLCTEENVARIVEDEARRQIEAALKEEVGNFFHWSSAGRAAVREAVHEHLSRMYPECDAG